MQPTAQKKAWLEQIESGNIECQHARIIKLVKSNEGITNLEIQQYLGIKRLSTATARLTELQEEGIVYKSGESKPAGASRNYSAYKYVPDTPSQECYGKLFALERQRKLLSKIINDMSYGKSFRQLAEQERDEIDTAITDLRINLADLQETAAA